MGTPHPALSRVLRRHACDDSVMTAWATERAAIENMIDRFGSGVFACVMDRCAHANGSIMRTMSDASDVFACSYDYEHALSEVLPSVAAKKLGKGGFMVLRPDSGDAVETVLQGLRAAEKVFGVTVNSKGYKIPNGCSVIQGTRRAASGAKAYQHLTRLARVAGDGIDFDTLRRILDAVLDAGFSAQAVGFGMGGGLLQKARTRALHTVHANRQLTCGLRVRQVNRDTLSFATKLCHIQYRDGITRDVMKAPKTDASKFSLPGILQVRREGGVPTVYSVPDAGKGRPLVAAEENLLRVVYDKRPVPGVWDDFATVRARVAAEWAAAPPRADPISQQLKHSIRAISPAHAARFDI